MDLKESVQIPGTKVKLPIIEVIAAGAAVIGAYVLLKGGSSQQAADVSAAPADTGAVDATNPATDNSILNGQLETMAQELAALQAAQQAQGVSGPSANVTSAATGAVPPASIPTSDVNTVGTPPVSRFLARNPALEVHTATANSQAKQLTRSTTPSTTPANPIVAGLASALTEILAIPTTSAKSAPKVSPPAAKSVAPVSKTNTSTKSVNPTVGKISPVPVKAGAPAVNSFQTKAGGFI